MGIFDIFGKKPSGKGSSREIYTSELGYDGANICIDTNIEESKAHLHEDFAVLLAEGIEKLIRERFVPYLKSDEFADMDDERIFNGLKLYDITYARTQRGYGRVQFFFESGDDCTAEIMESDAMEVYIRGGKIESIDCFVV